MCDLILHRSCVCELTKHMQKASESHYKAMIQVMSYLQDTKSYCLGVIPNKSSTGVLCRYTDSDYASDKDDRKSVTGYTIFYDCALVAHKSKMQHCITLDFHLPKWSMLHCHNVCASSNLSDNLRKPLVCLIASYP